MSLEYENLCIDIRVYLRSAFVCFHEKFFVLIIKASLSGSNVGISMIMKEA